MTVRRKLVSRCLKKKLQKLLILKMWDLQIIYDISKLCKDDIIERIQNGFYQLPNNYNISEEQLISNLLPYGTVCDESALFHYGYSDFAPRE